eukprot:Colp12_sorted_trinity150504_noHs@20736
MNIGGSKVYQAKPPQRGSFPLDHEGECKEFMVKYMDCMKKNAFDNAQCRLEAKDYLECRMEKQLMAEETWSRLGLKDVAETNDKATSTENNQNNQKTTEQDSTTK